VKGNFLGVDITRMIMTVIIHIFCGVIVLMKKETIIS